MWRLIQFIAIFALFLIFIVFNLENSSDISLGFVSFKDVPVFLTAFFAFIAGMTLTLPFIVTFWLRARKNGGAQKGATTNGGAPKAVAPNGATNDVRPARKSEPSGHGLSSSDFKDFGID